MMNLCRRRRSKQLWVITITPFLIIGGLTLLKNQLNVREVSEDEVMEDIDIYSWAKDNETFCAGNYIGYAHRFFQLKDAIYTPSDDKFSIDCHDGEMPNEKYKINYIGEFGLYKYSERLQTNDESSFGPKAQVSFPLPTVVIYREHAHNFYHAMTQWYGIYLISKVFGFKFSSLNILIVDGVPYNQIDDHWKTLFNNVTHNQDIKTPVLYNDIIFSFAGPESPMNSFYQKDLAYLNEFSNLFLELFGIHERKKLDCNKLVVVLSLRHDYIFHPEVDPLSKRNAERKFKNEEELIRTLQEEFKGHTVKTILAENVPLKDQLRLATNTDIMISMHGCTLTHTMFLPKHAAIFELYPKFWKFQDFYQTMARWSDIRYDRWRNEDKDNEFADHYTRVPPEVFRNYARTVKQYMGCRG